MRKLWVCLFYGLCVFTIVFSLFWMSLPKLELSPSRTDTSSASSPVSLAASAQPRLTAQQYYLCDKGGRVAVYCCNQTGAPDTLYQLTDIYVNLLPENDALRIKNGITVLSLREVDLLLEDLGG